MRMPSRFDSVSRMHARPRSSRGARAPRELLGRACIRLTESNLEGIRIVGPFVDERLLGDHGYASCARGAFVSHVTPRPDWNGDWAFKPWRSRAGTARRCMTPTAGQTSAAIGRS